MKLILLCVLFLPLVYTYRIISLKPVRYLKNPNPVITQLTLYKWPERNIPRLVAYVYPRHVNFIQDDKKIFGNYQAYEKTPIKPRTEDLNMVTTPKNKSKPKNYFDYISTIKEGRNTFNLYINVTKLDAPKQNENENKNFEEHSTLEDIINEPYSHEEPNVVTKPMTPHSYVKKKNASRKNTSIEKKRLLLKDTSSNKVTTTKLVFAKMVTNEVVDNNMDGKENITKHEENQSEKGLKIQDHTTTTSATTSKISTTTLANAYNLSTTVINAKEQKDVKNLTGSNLDIVKGLLSNKSEVVNRVKVTKASPQILSSKLDHVHINSDVIPIEKFEIENLISANANDSPSTTIKPNIRKTRDIMKYKSDKMKITKRKIIKGSYGSTGHVDKNVENTIKLPRSLYESVLVEDDDDTDLSIVPLMDETVVKNRVDDYVSSIIVKNLLKRLRGTYGIKIKSKPIKKPDQRGQVAVEISRSGYPFDNTNIPLEADQPINKIYDLINEVAPSVLPHILQNGTKFHEMLTTQFPRQNEENQVLSKGVQVISDDEILKSKGNPKAVERMGRDDHKHICIFEKMPKLYSRFRRKAEIADEDLPYNFLQLEPVNGIDGDNGNSKALEEMLEEVEVKPDVDVQQILDVLKDELNVDYLGKYDEHPNPKKERHTYVRKHGSGVHPYHSHIAEMLWKPYADIYDHASYAEPARHVNPKEFEPATGIETDDIDSLHNLNGTHDNTTLKVYVVPTTNITSTNQIASAKDPIQGDSDYAEEVIQMFQTKMKDSKDVTSAKPEPTKKIFLDLSTQASIHPRNKNKMPKNNTGKTHRFWFNEIEENSKSADLQKLKNEIGYGELLLDENVKNVIKVLNMPEEDFLKATDSLNPTTEHERTRPSMYPTETSIRTTETSRKGSNITLLNEITSDYFEQEGENFDKSPKNFCFAFGRFIPCKSEPERGFPVYRPDESEFSYGGREDLYPYGHVTDRAVHIEIRETATQPAVRETTPQTKVTEPAQRFMRKDVWPPEIIETTPQTERIETTHFTKFEKVATAPRRLDPGPTLYPPIHDTVDRAFERLSEFDNYKQPQYIIPTRKPSDDMFKGETSKNKHLLGLWGRHKGKQTDSKSVGGVSPLEIWQHSTYHARHFDAKENYGPVKFVETDDLEEEGDDRLKRHADTNAGKRRKRPRLFCAVLKRAGEQDQVKQVEKTWGKRCDTLVFITSKKDQQSFESLTNTNDTDDTVAEGAAWEYLKAALRFVYELHYDHAEWFLKSDIESYVIVDNLHRMVKDYNYNEPYYFGLENLQERSNFVLSKTGLKKLVRESYKSPKCVQDGYDGIESCLKALNIKMVRPRDSHNRPLFYSSDPFGYDALRKNDSAIGPIPWSQSAVAFQKVQLKDMLTLDYFIYHISPYGVKVSTDGPSDRFYNDTDSSGNEVANDINEKNTRYKL